MGFCGILKVMEISTVDFEWDEEKEKMNIIKHGVSFRAAERVFFDPARIERHDNEHSTTTEDHWQTVGVYEDALFVVYLERGEKTRIISARVAEPIERRMYNGNDYTQGWYRVNS
jgi:uncharacterized DUF497 family protein